MIRAAVLGLAVEVGWRCEEVREPATRLAGSQGAFATNSLIGTVAVVELDGARLPAPNPRLVELLGRASKLAVAPGG